ncbi:MoxR family ATPase [Candidatus Accumulibacter vicinus]|uniref:ATPase family associated with various cellular activities (AAA) n=1 Tax=Candidatus Accumulibacter vicinus TaxID=2954382 RepID=A0A084XY36_9PROT|nr:MoxR family ATPase [Candidatus Accumulibacter vicinus]KFB67380.1 MAG: ATPase family associated with various cellular activities (AAA) [Candidatus Accumulibacter vicinus]
MTEMPYSIMTEMPYKRKAPDTRLPYAKTVESLTRDRHTDPRHYDPGDDLAAAVNVALMLGRPLLVTGEPGTGKTELARSVAWQLGYPLFRFDTKSSSIARDLFYTYDSIGRFDAAYLRAARERKGSEPDAALPVIDDRDFIHYQALGQAILVANGRDALNEWLANPDAYREWLPKDWPSDRELPCRAVVLIDEIDKAPRDFPNDLLAEIEELRFAIPELGNVVRQATKDFQPVVVITSNSEKHLPDAFLRRCVYHHIDFPDGDRERLKEIIHLRTGLDANDPLLADSIEFLARVRGIAKLGKKPATAEFIDWLAYLRRIGAESRAWLVANRTDKRVMASLGVLCKSQDDVSPVRQELLAWLNKK